MEQFQTPPGERNGKKNKDEGIIANFDAVKSSRRRIIGDRVQ